MRTSRKLSKTNYLVYRDCVHNAWVKIHRPEVYHARPPSVFEQAVMDTGNDVDVRARDIFPGGVLIRRGDAVGTAQLLAERYGVLYQPVFETDRYTTACDVLVWSEDRGVYDLYEVKASTSGDDRKAKDELYAHDLAFQANVLAECGVPLGRFNLVRLDSSYVSDGALDLDRLFTREDFTDRVTPLLETVGAEMDTAHDVLSLTTMPPAPCACVYKGRSSHCTSFSYINGHVPGYSVHDLTRIGASPRRLRSLVDAGILDITDVPDDFDLTANQANQVRAARQGQAFLEVEPLGEFLNRLRYPISFLDYETYPCALPRFAGFRPYDHVPFQFSQHVVSHPGGEAVHRDFLFTGRACPDEYFIGALKDAIPEEGSVVVWNRPFERGINAKLAERMPEARAFLEQVNERIVDLMDVFTGQMVVHPKFRGRTSIKWVLPALVPQLSYQGLAIQEGATASETWNRIVTGDLEGDEAEEARKDLLTYCKRDSLAMVEIWRALLAAVAAREIREAG